jgi:hypothetical protein
LSDVTLRPKWDFLCERTEILERITPSTCFQYVLLRSMWPTSARDLCLLSHCRILPNGAMLNVTKSKPHAKCPVGISGKSVIRMQAGIAGQVVVPHPDQPNVCRVVQLIDGDMGGWIPKNIIQYGKFSRVLVWCVLTVYDIVANKILPKSLNRANRRLGRIAFYEHSRILSQPSLSGTDASSSIQASESRALVNANVTNDQEKMVSPSSTTQPSALLNSLDARVQQLEAQMRQVLGQTTSSVNRSQRPLITANIQHFLKHYLPRTTIGVACVAVLIMIIKRIWR